MGDGRRDFYVYVLFRQDATPCYVGKGRNDRWLQHERRLARGLRPHNPHLANIIASCGGVIPKVKVREGLASAEALSVEIALIAAIGRKANGTGPLVNLTDGGDGMTGHKLTDEHKSKIGTAIKGKVRSKEFCEKIGARRRGVKASPETLERLRASHQGIKPTAETIAKRNAKNTGKKRSAEFCEQMRILNLGHKVSDETRKKISAANVGKLILPAQREKMKKWAEAHYADPIERKKLSERMTAWWKRRKAEINTNGPPQCIID